MSRPSVKPPAPPPSSGSSVQKTHQHIYEHLETTKRSETINSHNSDANYIRIDQFFCKICLDIKVIKKAQIIHSREIIPDWY